MPSLISPWSQSLFPGDHEIKFMIKRKSCLKTKKQTKQNKQTNEIVIHVLKPK
jgi:hypothetical protein